MHTNEHLAGTDGGLRHVPIGKNLGVSRLGKICRFQELSFCPMVAAIASTRLDFGLVAV
jgi:hypothetical protein